MSTYACPSCPRGFSSLPGLNYHIAHAHTNRAELDFQCQIEGCKKKSGWADQSGLERHNDRIHPDDEEKEKKKKFECDICGKAWYVLFPLPIVEFLLCIVGLLISVFLFCTHNFVLLTLGSTICILTHPNLVPTFQTFSPPIVDLKLGTCDTDSLTAIQRRICSSTSLVTNSTNAVPDTVPKNSLHGNC